MYGSIMGLTKDKVDKRFAEIVKFSELEDYIDQPLRTYSTGMTTRLAFSVAINVDADILIVDEALAVGDAIFQHRCFQKIRDMQNLGKTILYVGHDTEAVRNLCTYALLLDGGQIIEKGDPNEVVNKYHALIAERERVYHEANLIEHGELPGSGFIPIYDFVKNLKNARVNDPALVCELAVNVQSTRRKVIFAHPPSEVEYSLDVEPGSSLAFAIGLLPDSWERIHQGVKFTIDVDFAGEQCQIFARTLQPKRNIGDRGWHNFTIPLEMFKGKHVTISLRTSGLGDDLSHCQSVWGWMKMIRPVDRPSEPQPMILPEAKSKGFQFTGDRRIRYGNKRAEITSIVLNNSAGLPSISLRTGENGTIKIWIISNDDFNEPVTVGCTIRNRHTTLYGMNTRWKNCDLDRMKKGEKSCIVLSFRFTLGSGYYSLTPAIATIHPDSTIEVHDRIEDNLIFQILNNEIMEGVVDLHAEIEVQRP
jgi:hypothetical protein